VRVVFFPDVQVYKDNLYWEPLKEGLEQKGVEFSSSDHKIYLNRGWLLGHRSRVDIIHLHHIEPQYAAERPLPSAHRLARYAGKLLLARLLGYRIVWTVHNLYPHEQPRPSSFDHLANAVMVHCSFARDFIGKVYLRRRNVFTLEHPNYICAYPNTTFKKEARKWLGLCDQQKVLFYFGAVRPYKGIDHAMGDISAFTDSDCISDRDWLKRLIAPYEKPEVGINGGCVLEYPTNPSTNVEIFIKEAGLVKGHSEPVDGKVNFITTQNVSYRKELLEKCGKFDEKIVFGNMEFTTLDTQPGGMVFSYIRSDYHAITD